MFQVMSATSHTHSVWIAFVCALFGGLEGWLSEPRHCRVQSRVNGEHSVSSRHTSRG
ncbi:hypothetical protein B0H11DRAFT_2217115 [Mycena galericulata]|nr:hypothetical protein B0H11DRAFT_2256956 [Mycena galericulata]KAJ7509377.1 hypothetical protein B0H11DRAFT_2217115 [Mycena galericulata]